jgi:hypothetical protein
MNHQGTMFVRHRRWLNTGKAHNASKLTCKRRKEPVTCDESDAAAPDTSINAADDSADCQVQRLVMPPELAGLLGKTLDRLNGQNAAPAPAAGVGQAAL